MKQVRVKVLDAGQHKNMIVLVSKCRDIPQKMPRNGNETNLRTLET